MKRLSLPTVLLMSLLLLVLAGCGNNTPIPQPPPDNPPPTNPPPTNPPPVTPPPTNPPPVTPPPTNPPPVTPPPTNPPPTTGATISGTVTAAGGEDLMGTVILACTLDFADCPAGTAVEQTGASASYTVADVPTGEHYVVALQDTNGDGEPGNEGDLVGFYTTDGANPAPVTAPATAIDITMTPVGEQTDPGPTPEPSTISGTVTASGGEDLMGAFVLACTPDLETCDYGATLEASGSSAGYVIADVPSGEYVVIAAQDTTGDEELGAGDLFGVYTTDGETPATVSPPATDIDITVATLTEASNRLTPQAFGSVERSFQRQRVLRAISPHVP